MAIGDGKAPDTDDAKQTGGTEMFYRDENGKKQDAGIHEAILAQGDSYDYRMASYNRAKQMGFPDAEDFNPDNPKGFCYMPDKNGRLK